MNLTDDELSAVNMISASDSLNAPLMELKVKNNANTIVPLSNSLIIYVDKDSTITEDRRQYVFPLISSLKYLSNVK